MEDNFDLRILGPHRQCRLLPLARHLSRFHGHVIKLDLRQQQDHLAVVAIATGSFLVLRIHAANGHRRPFLCLARSTPPKIAPIAPHSPPWLSVTSPHQAESSWCGQVLSAPVLIVLRAAEPICKHSPTSPISPTGNPGSPEHTLCCLSLPRVAAGLPYP